MQPDKIKLEKAAEYLKLAFDEIGLSCASKDMRETPIRCVKWLSELAQNQGKDPVLTTESLYDADKQIKLTTFDDMKVNELIIETNIDYTSSCGHHLLPFYGTATIGYLPNEDGTIIGASKIPRILNHFANQPQTQEYLTQKVATYLQDITKARFVGVILKGTHTCCSCRGVRKQGMVMITSCFLPSNHVTKQEFLLLSQQ